MCVSFYLLRVYSAPLRQRRRIKAMPVIDLETQRCWTLCAYEDQKGVVPSGKKGRNNWWLRCMIPDEGRTNGKSKQKKELFSRLFWKEGQVQTDGTCESIGTYLGLSFYLSFIRSFLLCSFCICSYYCSSTHSVDPLPLSSTHPFSVNRRVAALGQS